MKSRFGLSALGLIPVLGLYALLLFAAPDGRERTEWLQFLGHFHPLTVHMPIALILLVPVLELVGRRLDRPQLRDAAPFVLLLAAISATVAPLLGWSLAWSGGYSGALVAQHMWGGVSVPAIAWSCWLLRGRSAGEHATPYKLSKLYVVALTGLVMLVSWTGYRGGQLAHGEDHLVQHMPASLRGWLGLPARIDTGTFYEARIAPIFATHCVVCHGPTKQKANLRLDSYASAMRGGKDGPVIKATDAKASELYRRITRAAGDKDAMPAEGKPPLGADEIKLIELWIAAGASATQRVAAMGAGPSGTLGHDPLAQIPLAPDYRPQQQAIASLEQALGVRLVPRSQNSTDGLILRTVSFPARCDDAVLAKLVPIAPFIVEAELARTRVSDAGLKVLRAFVNLRSLDLSHTAVTSAGISALESLDKLASLNLTATAVNAANVAPLRAHKALKRLYVFQTRAR